MSNVMIRFFGILVILIWGAAFYFISGADHILFETVGVSLLGYDINGRYEYVREYGNVYKFIGTVVVAIPVTLIYFALHREARKVSREKTPVDVPAPADPQSSQDF